MSHRTKTKPAPRITIQDKAIGEWRSFERRMNVSGPEQDRRYTCELQYREDEVALQAMAQFGDPSMRREAWRVFARNTGIDRMREIAQLTGEVPPSWMEDIYHLYTPEEVKELVIYNPLSMLDAPEVAAYIEGTSPLPPISTSELIARAVQEGWPLEDVLVRLVRVEEGLHALIVSITASDVDVRDIAYGYGVDVQLVITLLDILSMRRRNESSEEIHLYSASWVSTYAPWLIVTSSADLQLAFMQFFDSYRLQLLYGSKDDIQRLLNTVDPVRLRLADYYPNRREKKE